MVLIRAGSQGRASSWMDLTKRLPEMPARMCLIGKADAQGYFAQRCRAGNHQMTRSLQPSPHHVSGRWFSEGLFEGPRECVVLRCATALRSSVWMVRCIFSSMKARTRAICQTANAPGLAPLARERRSISDCRIDDAVASAASRSSSRVARPCCSPDRRTAAVDATEFRRIGLQSPS